VLIQKTICGGFFYIILLKMPEMKMLRFFEKYRGVVAPLLGNKFI